MKRSGRSIYILGVNCAYHESSVALVTERGIIAAIEEERISRIKHAKQSLVSNCDELPIGSLNCCLKIRGIALSQVDYIAFSFNPRKRLENNVNLGDEVIDGSWGTQAGETLFYEKLMSIPSRFREMGFRGEFIFVDHCMAHAASTFFPSSFPESAIISVDGIGEIESTTLAMGKDERISVLEQIGYPHSLGFLWEKIAGYLGMSEHDACKVMSLASFGDADRFYGQYRTFVDVTKGGFKLDGDVCRFRSDDFSLLERLFGLPKIGSYQPVSRDYMDVAAGVQKITTEILLNLANRAHELTGSTCLCLAGGVALNCVANTAIFERGPFEQIFVQPAANDAGTSLGAALHVYHDLFRGQGGSSFHMRDTYLGPEFNQADILDALYEFGVAYNTHDNLADEVATLISQGHVVGWFQGRMEFGPRALGNRSLLADPRNSAMVNRMNCLVKHREDYRPFCPSVLAEDAKDWFVIRKDAISSQYMLMAYPVQQSKRALIPAVVHVDETSRIQAVDKRVNPKFHALISSFKKKTGVPLLMNTSFNDREPIVCTPEDAIKTFLKTGIDFLAIGDFLLHKRAQPAAEKPNRANTLGHSCSGAAEHGTVSPTELT
jgi:carbamoyltransferase